MSDLYLVLRHRLADVTQEWATIDGKVLVDARARKGLSREAFGAIVGVVAKTVERYEKDGRVPRHLLPRVAEALDLEIEEAPARPKVRVEVNGEGDEMAALREEVSDLREADYKIVGLLEEVLRRLA